MYNVHVQILTRVYNFIVSSIEISEGKDYRIIGEREREREREREEREHERKRIGRPHS